ncbi:MAG: di-trans,poly-cis-decaprenylcistransferase [Candidatus Omnitrophica bacterium CG1_02_44_16]|nr:MAG: di-trans,poly-cis-decaprenylcistransferase [Candidatus Omnitrophica bacterium CG1_02_44_16]PIY81944.1 MAG: isoprenyl transferase [Candidatus Omnitrophica bacterium CG_4_10_14_0_8_um_filter_44_12]PIZ84785.1 MAG: isoprenyl transferase [Candidatus Omnitrophica bacterium CG_4_10_14_0_2_um_filter_44_9]
MLDRKKIPEHIAIIMDGNGRWAKRRGLSRSEGHRKGMAVLKDIIKASLELGVKFLTVYAFSTENWKRPKLETDFLMDMCEKIIVRELPYMLKSDIRLRHIGRPEVLTESLRKCINRTEELTRNNRRLVFGLAFNYGSRLEILDAVRAIAQDVKTGALLPEDITEELFKTHLYTKDSPDPDLLIRTSGEMRVSNFLLWQIAYSEFYVIKKQWPDFNKRELMRAIEVYQKRCRRFGGIE